MAADGQPTMSAASAASAPSYPSSNRRQVDWDKVDKEVSEELEGEKLEGDAALECLRRGQMPYWAEIWPASVGLARASDAMLMG